MFMRVSLVLANRLLDLLEQSSAGEEDKLAALDVTKILVPLDHPERTQLLVQLAAVAKEDSN